MTTTNDTLVHLDDLPIPAHVSRGYEARGRDIAARTVRCLDWLADVWNTGGPNALPEYQRQLGHRTLDHAQVLARLQAIDPAVAHAVRLWPQTSG